MENVCLPESLVDRQYLLSIVHGEYVVRVGVVTQPKVGLSDIDGGSILSLGGKSQCNRVNHHASQFLELIHPAAKYTSTTILLQLWLLIIVKTNS